MLLYVVVVIATICSFLSALAIFTACVVAGRNRSFAQFARSGDDPLSILGIERKQVDDTRLNRLADGI